MPAATAGCCPSPRGPSSCATTSTVTAGIGERTRLRAFNALYGNRVDGVNPDVQDELGAENLALAAHAAARSAAPCSSSRSAAPPTR